MPLLPRYRYGNPILECPNAEPHYRLSRRRRDSAYRISIQAQSMSAFSVKGTVHTNAGFLSKFYNINTENVPKISSINNVKSWVLTTQ